MLETQITGRIVNHFSQRKTRLNVLFKRILWVVGEGGFEPPKSLTTDLQSAPFGHSGTLPYLIGAGGRTRTPDLLITNQLLYQLSYTSILTGTFFRAQI